MSRKTLITHPQGYLFVHGSILCAVWMNSFGGINGYARCPPNHPLHGLDYEDNRVWPLFNDIHGGITYAGRLPVMERPSTEWWFGFDTMHAGDWIPFLEDEALMKRAHDYLEGLGFYELLEAMGFDVDDLKFTGKLVTRDEAFVMRGCITMAGVLMQGEDVSGAELKAAEFEVAELLKHYHLQPQ